MTELALSKSLEAKFDDTVARLPDALASEGLGVLTQIDVQSPRITRTLDTRGVPAI
jgi:uncharacterized protein (DUF302 family)